MKYKVLFSILSFVFLIIVFSSFEDQEDSNSPSFISKKYALEELMTANHRVSDLFNAAKAHDSVGVIQKFKEARIQYKKLNFI